MFAPGNIPGHYLAFSLVVWSLLLCYEDGKMNISNFAQAGQTGSQSVRKL